MTKFFIQTVSGGSFFIGKRKAKAKYKPSKTIGASHSLGASIQSYLPLDRVTTLDKGATIGQSGGKNEKAYRTSGDVVSLMNSGSHNMTTLTNPNKQFRTGNPLVDYAVNTLNSHNVSNIKSSNLFV